MFAVRMTSMLSFLCISVILFSKKLVSGQSNSAQGLLDLVTQLRASNSLPACYNPCLPADLKSLCDNPASSYTALTGCLSKGCAPADAALITTLVANQDAFVKICAQAATVTAAAAPKDSSSAPTTTTASAASRPSSSSSNFRPAPVGSKVNKTNVIKVKFFNTFEQFMLREIAIVYRLGLLRLFRLQSTLHLTQVLEII
jgi:hypothetical protein